MRPAFPRALRALAVRNYRFYFAGQVVSIAGNWMQNIAIAWLVLNLTGSAFALGATVALQTTPYLLVGFWGGLVADRSRKHRLLVFTQAAQIAPPMILCALVALGSVRIWMVWAIVVSRGAVQTVDNPARQSFVNEMVGRNHILNAVSMNAAITQAGRLIGPAVAAVVIATVGVAACFFLNGLTFLFMVVMLLAMRAEELTPSPPAPAGRGQLRAALRSVRHQFDLRLPLVLMAIVGLLSFNFTVVLPAIARYTFHGTATTYAVMACALGLGALGGAVVSGLRTSITPRLVAAAATAFGVTLAIAAAADSLVVVVVALTAVGAASTSFSTAVQSALQLGSSPEMRGRVLSLYQIVYQGTTPLGALAVGALASTAGARSGLALGAAGSLAAGCYGLWSTRSTRVYVPGASG